MESTENEKGFLIKFDSCGCMTSSVPRKAADIYGGEKRFLADGYVVVSEEDWKYYAGYRDTGKNGTGYIRDAKTNKPVSAPPAPPRATKPVEVAGETESSTGKILDSSNATIQRINTAVQAVQVAQAAGQKLDIDWTLLSSLVQSMLSEGVAEIKARQRKKK